MKKILTVFILVCAWTQLSMANSFSVLCNIKEQNGANRSSDAEFVLDIRSSQSTRIEIPATEKFPPRTIYVGHVLSVDYPYHVIAALYDPADEEESIDTSNASLGTTLELTDPETATFFSVYCKKK